MKLPIDPNENTEITLIDIDKTAEDPFTTTAPFKGKNKLTFKEFLMTLIIQFKILKRITKIKKNFFSSLILTTLS